MLNNFYKSRITTKFGGTAKLELFDYVNTAKKCGRVHIANKKNVEELLNVEPCFFEIDGKVKHYVAFYENLFLSYSIDEESMTRILRVSIKKPEDVWEFNKDNAGNFDLLFPKNPTAEVYIDYDVNVLNLQQCMGIKYESGSWNKMFYQSLTSFFKKVTECTEEYRSELSRMEEVYSKQTTI